VVQLIAVLLGLGFAAFAQDDTTLSDYGTTDSAQWSIHVSQSTAANTAGSPILHLRTNSEAGSPGRGILDPENTSTAPPLVAACTGLYVLSLAIESYTALP
jgi:hypothetical protein